MFVVVQLFKSFQGKSARIFPSVLLTAFICVVLIYLAFEAGLTYIIVSVVLAAVNLVVYSDFRFLQDFEQERQRVLETIQEMAALEQYMRHNPAMHTPPAPRASSGSEGEDVDVEGERPPLAQYEIVPNIV